ncbi:hypothetical protein H2202_011175 [Exophiala xenobiotica]|nr:hypothetical protein H2202_011175 [Exophiala xenobiotica]
MSVAKREKRRRGESQMRQETCVRSKKDSPPVAYVKEVLDETPVEFVFNDAPVDLAVDPEPEADDILDEPQPEAGAA